MKIKAINMKKYKRFFDLTIDLGENPKRIVALVGPNGCGKSSVFDAMLYNYMNICGTFGATGMKPVSYYSQEQKDTHFSGLIKIEFLDGDLYQVAKQLSDKKSILFSFRSAFRYNAQLNVRESRAIEPLYRNSWGATTASDLDQKIEINYRQLKIKYDKYLNEKDCRPTEAQAYIIGELNKSIMNCLNLSIVSLGNIEAGEGSIYFKKNDSDKTFKYDLLSAGEKEVVDILLDLYLRKDIYTNSIYIIDEPELHLNTAIQRKLLLEINKIVPADCQIWLATHSIGFLRALQEELADETQVIEFSEENQWASQAYVLIPMKKTRNDWKRIFSTALDDLTGLVSPKCIIYCEGRADPNKAGGERGLDAEVLNIIFGEKYPDVLFVSSGGNTELDQRSDIAISILSKALSELKILVLKDRDMASGKMTNEDDRQRYLKFNPLNHRVLKRFEIENYLFDKEVLKQYCESEQLEFNEEKYDNCILDINNQQVKEEVSLIRACCNIKGSVNAENFKKELAKFIDSSMLAYKELEEVIFERK